MKLIQIHKIFDSKLILVCLTTLSFISCNNKYECKLFNYEDFGLDTSLFKKKILFTNLADTLTFDIKEFTIEKKESSSPSFINADECRNGLFLTYYCKKLNLPFNYSIQTNNPDYSASFSCIHFIKDLNNLKTINDININIDSNDLMNEPSPIKYFLIKNGTLDNFVDSLDKKWTKL